MALYNLCASRFRTAPVSETILPWPLDQSTPNAKVERPVDMTRRVSLITRHSTTPSSVQSVCSQRTRP